MSGRWLTVANGLTLLRLLAAPAIVLALFAGDALAAAGLFWLAVASDFADGWAARRCGEASALGRLIDHGVDASFVAAASAALAAAGALPAPLPALIAIAFTQYALDSRRLAAEGPRPSALGRWNGIGYYVIVAVPVMRDALGLAWPGAVLVRGLGWLLVASTLVSITERAATRRPCRTAPGSPGAGTAGRSPR